MRGKTIYLAASHNEKVNFEVYKMFGWALVICVFQNIFFFDFALSFLFTNFFI